MLEFWGIFNFNNVQVHQNHMKNQHNRTYLKSLDSLHRNISLINVHSMFVINTNDLVGRLGDLTITSIVPDTNWTK